MLIARSIMIANLLSFIIERIKIITKILITSIMHLLSKVTDAFFYLSCIISTLIFTIT